MGIIPFKRNLRDVKLFRYSTLYKFELLALTSQHSYLHYSDCRFSFQLLFNLKILFRLIFLI